MPRVRLNDINLYYEEEGRGDALILICGLAGITRDWRLQVPHFSNHYRTIVFDNRGVGKTDKPKPPYSISQFAKDTISLMDHLKLKKANILGLSMGGMIAQELAILYPERIDKLILSVTNCGPKHSVMPEPWVIETIAQTEGLSLEEALRKSFPIIFTDSFLKEDMEKVEIFLNDRLAYPGQPFFAFQAQLKAVMEFDSYLGLSKIENQTLILTSKKDILVPPVNSEILAGKIRNSKLVIFENGGHLLNIERPEEFNDTVLNFLMS
jgi:pimeloyl-ACP methyl ester carboxylesterase